MEKCQHYAERSSNGRGLPKSRCKNEALWKRFRGGDSSSLKFCQEHKQDDDYPVYPVVLAQHEYELLLLKAQESTK